MASSPPHYQHVPPPVKAGDSVSLIFPAGYVKDKALVASASTLLSEWGLTAVFHQDAFAREGYLAGSDESRAQAVIDAFTDESTTAVISGYGGYGCTRILPLLRNKIPDDALRRKRFLGFSDPTALHSFLQHQLPGLVTFHTPMPATPFVAQGTPESLAALRRALFEECLADASPALCGRILQAGRAKEAGGSVTGKVVGGSLTLVTSLIGTPWQLDMKDAILFIEDVNETGYQVDRMLTQLNQAHNMTLFELLKGLVVGDFGQILVRDCPQGTKDPLKWFWIEQLDLPPTLPIIVELPLGHINDNRVLALGAMGSLDIPETEWLSIESPFRLHTCACTGVPSFEQSMAEDEHVRSTSS